MKKYFISFLVIFSISVIIIWYWKPTASMNIMTDAKDKPLYWVAPMDPNYQRDKPGKSPMGMDLVPVYADEPSDNKNIVKISPQVEQNLGVRIETVLRHDIARRIDTVGYITADENRIEHVHTYTNGWIKRLLVKTTGEHVKKGQLLLELYSPTLVNAQDEYLLALKSGNNALIKASHKKLLALGVSEIQIKELKIKKQSMELIKIFAGQAGIVSQLHIREGMHVKPNINIITLEDLSHIWIIGEVFERQAQWVKEGQPAEARLPYLPGEKWVGNIEYVYPQLDATTHTLKVRLHFNNPNERLKPNMYANITIFSSPQKNVLTIPREAVIYTEDSARVIVSLGNGQTNYNNE